MDIEIQDHFLYTKDHEWVSLEEDGEALFGITEYAQSSLGDITFIELPEEGSEVEQFEEFASVESVKAASDIFAPMSGSIVEVNQDLEDSPGLINQSPYDKGWLIRVKLSELDEKSNLMTADEYRNFLISQ